MYYVPDAGWFEDDYFKLDEFATLDEAKDYAKELINEHCDGEGTWPIFVKHGDVSVEPTIQYKPSEGGK